MSFSSGGNSWTVHSACVRISQLCLVLGCKLEGHCRSCVRRMTGSGTCPQTFFWRKGIADWLPNRSYMQSSKIVMRLLSSRPLVFNAPSTCCQVTKFYKADPAYSLSCISQIWLPVVSKPTDPHIQAPVAPASPPVWRPLMVGEAVRAVLY